MTLTAPRLALLLVLFCAVVTAGALAGLVAGGAVTYFAHDRQPVLYADAARDTGTVAERIRANTDDLPDSEAATLEVVRAARPAVVTVWNIGYAKTSFFAPAELRVLSEGSGVVFDERGYIATNAHVVQGAHRVEVVFLDGRRAEAEIVNLHADYDVAVLRTDAELPAVASLADSATLEPGMQVLAIGSPLGTQYQNTVTTGIVAGLNRRVTRRGYDWFTGRQFEEDLVGAPLIQTDAAINSGNSGGPLINLRGEVIALNTLIVRQDGGRSVEGLGFAIPSNVVKGLADEWIDGAKLGWLGVDFDTIDPVVAQQESLPRGAGALITRVYRDATGDRAGLQTGDIVIGIGGAALDLDHALADQLWRYRAGDTISLQIERDGETFSVEATLDPDPRSGS